MMDEECKHFDVLLNEKFNEIAKRILGDSVRIIFVPDSLEITVWDLVGGQMALRSFSERLDNFRAELLRIGFKSETRKEFETKLAQRGIRIERHTDKPDMKTFCIESIYETRDELMAANGWLNASRPPRKESQDV